MTEETLPTTLLAVTRADGLVDYWPNVERYQASDGALWLIGPRRTLIHAYARGVWTEIEPAAPMEPTS